MSAFGDYKAYKKFEPVYPSWKYRRDLTDAKRQEYLKQHPESINQEDIQRGKALIRAIDVMDEYSQKRAEDMEVAAEAAVAYGFEGALAGGAALGALIGRIKPVKQLLIKTFGKTKSTQVVGKALPLGMGALAGAISAFPLYSWAAKTEVAASRRGRFEAMRKDLQNPKSFAVLTEEQINLAQQRAVNINVDEDKKTFSLTKIIDTIKNMSSDTKEYKKQKKIFDLELIEAEKHFNDEISDKEIEAAKRDQQLLTKLVEKIDIASQDYAENAELASEAVITFALGFGALFNIILSKALDAMKVKSAAKINAVSQLLSVTIPIIISAASAQISKQASRVGRYKVKQELLQNPTQLAYVNDDNIQNITNVHYEPQKKIGILKFLVNAWKNNKEYNNYKKTTAKQEEKFYKAIETLELSPEQIKNAKTLQKNTFMTFNKVDEKSQQYSESIEALGKALAMPISLLFTAIGLLTGVKYLTKSVSSKSKYDAVSNFSKYVMAILLSTLPSIAFNAYVTKEQKKASRIANMLAVNEMSDYRHFR